MWYEKLEKELEENINQENALKMSRYMQNKFKFLGIKKTELIKILKKYLQKEKQIDWEFVNTFYKKEYREYQYIVIEYLKINKKLLNITDYDALLDLAITYSWWDTVDNIDSLIGIIAIDNEELKEKILKLSNDDNMWLKRISINYQQQYKDRTNTKYLEQAIMNNINSKEFFINKAIGWSLREYSKTNPQWVSDFIERNKLKLSKISIKEASKYLK